MVIDMTTPVLRCENLRKSYDVQVLNGINLTLPRGKIIGLLGPNGSGKTTLIKIIAGLLTPTSGRVSVAGIPVSEKTKVLVSYLPERNSLSDIMTIKQQIDFFEDFFPDFDRARAEEMLKCLGLDPSKRIKTLSKGMKEKVQLVLVMSRRAHLYLLDEPIGGVDPAARDYILNTIISNYSPKSTILISTHLISDIERVLDEFIFISRGDIIRQGSVDDIRNETGKSLDEVFREVFRC